ncbi:hypothetical protein E2C01_047934 [Portunus trituberculatus]|uniref:Uncharacterized protein n=1 Tax=Portunus trituberculatus TaxID=210409 RepID=A0A5B7GA65_PORTR|nr:hypothetical protein [Portunus trituberculatus]
MDPHTNLSNMWKQIKTISGQKPAKQASHPEPITEANRLINSFADRCDSVQLPPATQRKQRKLRPERRENISHACNAVAPTDVPFPTKELRDTLKPQKDTAAGADKISYSMIRESGDEAYEELLYIINQSYTSSRLPQAWKNAIFMPIHKPKEQKKFRPIFLLICLGKTAEKNYSHPTPVASRQVTPQHLCLHQ